MNSHCRSFEFLSPPWASTAGVSFHPLWINSIEHRITPPVKSFLLFFSLSLYLCVVNSTPCIGFWWFCWFSLDWTSKLRRFPPDLAPCFARLSTMVASVIFLMSLSSWTRPISTMFFAKRLRLSPSSNSSLTGLWYPLIIYFCKI